MTTKASNIEEGVQVFGEIGFDSNLHVSDEELEEFKQKIIEGGVNAKRILILTFDNAAATSITSKLEILRSELAINFESPEIRTLNAFGYKVIREFVPKEFRQIPNS